MKRAITACLPLALVFLFAPLFANGAQEGAEMSAEQMAEMDAWMKLAQPGEHHQHLDKYVGTWDLAVTFWMGPDAEPMSSPPGRAEVSWILGGRFLEWKNTGDFGGMPFEGRAFDGYSYLDTEYQSVWFDNFGTLLLNYTGDCSDDGESRVMKAQFKNPTTGGTIHNRVVYTWQDADHFTYESYMKEGDLEHQNMEVKYSRK